MDGGLQDVVVERLAADDLTQEVEQAVLAALAGDDELETALAVSGAGVPAGAGGTGDGDVGPLPAVYLERLEVAGFRGIGAPAVLKVRPGPGLTVVCGRNGSGKSSFAEALEVLLAGTLKRWEQRSADWKGTWRCLHAKDVAIEADFLVEGVNGTVTARRTWPTAATALEEGTSTVQAVGRPRSGLEAFGWDRAVGEHRPFLSHAELEALLDKPKDLHDQLNDLLGLDDLQVAGRRLRDRRLGFDRQVKGPRAAAPELIAELGESGDRRAEEAASLLGAGRPDLDALEALAVGVTAPVDDLAGALGQIAGFTLPDQSTAEEAAAELEDAARAADEAGSAAAATAVASGELLRLALEHTHPGDACPVCGTTGVINDGWRTRTESTLASLEGSAGRLRAARVRLRDATDTARQLIRPLPAVLAGAEEAGVGAAALVEAWTMWDDPPDEARDLAAHLAGTLPIVADALSEVQASARAELEARQDLWAPLAKRILEWTASARAAATAADARKVAKQAEDWLKAANDALRHQRLLPLATEVKRLWDELRQGSDVDLLQLRLTGSGNRAKVDFQVSVDGADATGLGVMSQGEANALALSVFLPRAMLPGSPFAFLVIDDPVQAMDPSKVDGLARVLAQAGRTRQVLVFTHDDRLPEAVRRLQLPGRVLRVSRRSQSQVQVDPASDPFDNLLRDASQLLKSDNVPDAAAARIVPGMCRTAIEIVLGDATRRRLLAGGARHADVEDALAEANRLWERLSLAAFGELRPDSQVRSWLQQKVDHHSYELTFALNRGTHGAEVHLDHVVDDTRRLAAQLRRALG